MGLNVPPTALKIYQKAEQYRQEVQNSYLSRLLNFFFLPQIGNLDLIVNMYNEMSDTLLPLERPLVEKEIEAIDGKLAAGLTQLNWNSSGVAEFISAAMTTVKAVYSTVKVRRGAEMRL